MGAVCGPGTEEIEGVCVAQPPPPVEPSIIVPTAGALPAIDLPAIAVPPPAPPAAAALIVSIAADGALSVGGSPLTDDAALDGSVRAYSSALPRPEDASARIIAHPEAPHARTMDIMTRLREAGLTRMTIELRADGDDAAEGPSTE